MQRTSDITSSRLGIILQVIYPPETVTYLRATLKLPRAECSKTVYSNSGELTVDILLLNNAKRVVENNNNKKTKYWVLTRSHTEKMSKTPRATLSRDSVIKCYCYYYLITAYHARARYYARKITQS